MLQRYLVRLSAEERGVCPAVIQKPQGSAKSLRRAQILGKAEADGPAWIDARSAVHSISKTQDKRKARDLPLKPLFGEGTTKPAVDGV